MEAALPANTFWQFITENVTFSSMKALRFQPTQFGNLSHFGVTFWCMEAVLPANIFGQFITENVNFWCMEAAISVNTIWPFETKKPLLFCDGDARGYTRYRDPNKTPLGTHAPIQKICGFGGYYWGPS